MMVQQVRTLATEPDDLSLSLGGHTVKGENLSSHAYDGIRVHKHAHGGTHMDPHTHKMIFKVFLIT